MITHLHRFMSDRRGGVAIAFGLALVPLIGFAGAAMDYSQVSALRIDLQKSADAAAIVAVRGNDSFEERQTAALASIHSNLRTQPGVTVSSTIVPIIRDGVEVEVSVSLSSTLPTTFLRVLGIDNVDVAVESRASGGRNERYDVAFVLDTTGSMAGARLNALKQTTTDLIDDFIERRGTDDQVQVSVVPFGQYVNVGLGRRNSAWLDVPSDYRTPDTRTCRMVREVVDRTCRQEWVPPRPARPRTCYDDGRAYECGSGPRAGYYRQVCDPIYGPNMVEQCTNRSGRWVRWNGCVGSRNMPGDTRDGSYGVPIPGIMDVTCGSPLIEATDDLQFAKSRINALTTRGETYIPAGLIWGWRALSVQEPLAARENRPEAPVRRYMVLVTDGRNTRSPRYPDHNGTNTNEANRLMEETCVNMAADDASNITLYTIAFEVTDTDLKALLEDCSTINNGAFFDAANATELALAMQEIGSQLSTVRLTH